MKRVSAPERTRERRALRQWHRKKGAPPFGGTPIQLLTDFCARLLNLKVIFRRCNGLLICFLRKHGPLGKKHPPKVGHSWCQDRHRLLSLIQAASNLGIVDASRTVRSV